MVEEEEMSQKTGERRRHFRPKLPPPIPWPPKSEDRFSPSFFIHAEGIRKVAWPPPEDDLVYNYSDAPDQTGAFYGPVNSQQYVPNQQQQSNWPSNGPQQQQQQQQQPYYQPAMSSPPPPPPQTVQLRQEAPIRQKPQQVYDAQPPVKRRVPFRCRGDEKWPPEAWKMKMAMEAEEAPAMDKPGRAHRDYRPFFAKNAINMSYPPYRPPPGTQHYYEYLMSVQGQ